MAQGRESRRIRELEKEAAYLRNRLEKLLEQQARQEKIAESHHVLLKRINREYQELLDELSASHAELEREVAERRITQEELRKANEQLSGILEHSTFPIFIKDASHRFVYMNPCLSRQLGMAPDECRGSTVWDFFPPHEAETFQRGDERVMHEKRSITAEETMTVGDKTHLLITTKFPLTNDTGEIWGLCGVAQDVTEVKALELEALRAAQLASLGELAAGVAHEINNPVNGIINYAQLIADAATDAEGAGAQGTEYARRIVAEGGRVAEIVRRLLGFARSPGRTRRPVDLVHVLDDALGLVEASLGKSGVVLTRRLPEALPPVLGDHHELQQVFLSLITNARQSLEEKGTRATGANEVEKTLEITAWEVVHDDAPAVRIAFRDSGVGLDEESQKRAFEPFYTFRSREQGTGLGLSIAHRIVRDHGGTIQLSSEPDEYAEFVITLPAA